MCSSPRAPARVSPDPVLYFIGASWGAIPGFFRRKNHLQGNKRHGNQVGAVFREPFSIEQHSFLFKRRSEPKRQLSLGRTQNLSRPNIYIL